MTNGSNGTTASSTPAKFKTYNFVGSVSEVVVRQDGAGRDWVHFNLMRPTGVAMSCVSFADRAVAFLKGIRERTELKLFGAFETRKVAYNGQEHSFRNFKVLSAEMRRAAVGNSAQEPVDEHKGVTPAASDLVASDAAPEIDPDIQPTETLTDTARETVPETATMTGVENTGAGEDVLVEVSGFEADGSENEIVPVSADLETFGFLVNDAEEVQKPKRVRRKKQAASAADVSTAEPASPEASVKPKRKRKKANPDACGSEGLTSEEPECEKVTRKRASRKKPSPSM